MNDIKDGGPAFPVMWTEINDGKSPQITACEPGMSLRDWFAGKALAGLLADPDDTYCDASDEEGIELERREYADARARDAYRYADAMLRARGQS